MAIGFREFEAENAAPPKRPLHEHPFAVRDGGMIQFVCPVTVDATLGAADRTRLEYAAFARVGQCMASAGWRGEGEIEAGLHPYLDIGAQGHPGKETAVASVWISGLKPPT